MLDALREMLAVDPGLSLAWGGFALGVLFGVTGQVSQFCTLGALSDLVLLDDRRRLRAWLLAIAVALVGAQSLNAAGIVELDRSMYLGPRLPWLAHALGGLAFGFGMVLAGGCPSRNLVRAGGGDVRALLVVMIIGSAAYATLGGVLGPARVALEGVAAVELGDGASQALPALMFGAHDGTTLALAFAVAALLTVYCFAAATFRAAPREVASGIAVGACVAAGWTLHGLTDDPFALQPRPPLSLSFVRPAGDLLDWLERYTASPLPGFGAASVVGVLAGAAAVALWRRQFTWRGFADSADTLRHLLGAVLMGVGGVLALGCTIGQGVSGLSTLSVGSIVSVAAIVAGAWLGLRALERLA